MTSSESSAVPETCRGSAGGAPSSDRALSYPAAISGASSRAVFTSIGTAITRWSRASVRVRSPMAMFAANPGQGLNYQVGKSQIQRFLADAMRAHGEVLTCSASTTRSGSTATSRSRCSGSSSGGPPASGSG